MTAEIDASLRRLRTDTIDLYYIHWPRTGADMRPRMEALEAARAAGQNPRRRRQQLSVLQMRELQEVGRIDAHQLGYNLIWRYAEDDLIPFCREHDIAVVTYSALAHGILTAKFGPKPDLREATSATGSCPSAPTSGRMSTPASRRSRRSRRISTAR